MNEQISAARFFWWKSRNNQPKRAAGERRQLGGGGVGTRDEVGLALYCFDCSKTTRRVKAESLSGSEVRQQSETSKAIELNGIDGAN